MRTQAIDQILVVGISIERLDKYLAGAGGNLDIAMSLYERNMRLSESFYSPLQAMEICFRNRLHNALSSTYGANWFRAGNAPLENDALQNIQEALADLGRAKVPVVPGAVVAELSFGFWVSLLGPRYDASLWRGAIYKGFRENGGFMKRARVHGRFNALRRFRNRIAHHEPIFLNDLQARHAEIIEATAWMYPETAAWSQFNSRFPAVFAAP